MEIIDVNHKKRNAKSIKRVSFDRVNDCFAEKKINKDGELVTVREQEIVETTEQYAEVILVGKNGREWKEWYPLKEFEYYNPEVKYDS